jgi:hypothetical protein
MAEEEIEHLISNLGKTLDDYSPTELNSIEEFLFADQKHRARDAVLGIALHLTPQQALEKERGVEDPVGPFDSKLEPYQIIRKHLIENYEFDKDTARDIGDKLGQIWRDWFEDDRSMPNASVIKSKLKNDQRNRCANCNVKLEDEYQAASFVNDDQFKPLHQFKRSQTTAELDHIEPLSQFGRNNPSNFQVLCRFCNQGKGDSKNISILEQLEKSERPIKLIDPEYRREMFYAVTANTEVCSECGNKAVELTIRDNNHNGCYTVSNLKTVCVNCAYGGK